MGDRPAGAIAKAGKARAERGLIVVASQTAFLVVVGIALLIVIALLVVLSQFVKLWIQAYFANTPVSMIDLIGMRLRKTNPRVIVYGLIRMTAAGLSITTAELERHYLAGGHVPEMVTAMVAAETAGMPVNWQELAAVDLAGEDVLAHVRSAIKAQSSPPPTDAGGE
jgi:uncharacterized protein YqfA (UPF0365 family)